VPMTASDHTEASAAGLDYCNDVTRWGDAVTCTIGSVADFGRMRRDCPVGG